MRQRRGVETDREGEEKRKEQGRQSGRVNEWEDEGEGGKKEKS